MEEVAVFENFLRANGFLLTGERLEIARVVSRMDDSFGVAEVCAETADGGFVMAASTIYRNIKLLMSAGIVERIALHHPGKQRFRKIKQHKVSCRLCYVDFNKELDLESPELEQVVLELCRKHKIKESGIVVKIQGCSCKCEKP